MPALDNVGRLESFPQKDLVLFVGEAPGIKNTIATAFIEEKFQVRQIRWIDGNPNIGNDQIPILPTERIDQLMRKICPHGERVGAIVNFVGFGDGKSKSENYDQSLLGFFNLLKVFENDLRASAGNGGGQIATITPMGGQFGLTHPHPFSPEAAGAIGITKSVGLEWPEIHARCIDIDPLMEADRIAAQLVQEIFINEKVREIGLDQNGRWKITLEEQPVRFRSPEINSGSVLLILGGALGITAEIAKDMAKRYHPKIIIVGRSSRLHQEADETRYLEDVTALRSYYIHHSKETNAHLTPTAINQKINSLIKNRQLTLNINAMEDFGARVEYVSMDVRNAAMLSTFIKDIYSRYGKIDGVIHGAGIIDDHLIRDKSLDSFKNVFDTKVIPARILMEHLQPDSLKFLVFFSSIAARFGNAGQSDYCAANEVLNKYAHCLAKKWTDTRVVSIGWGPWETGMVTEDLKKFYRKHNIGLIPTEVGIDLFITEIGVKENAPAEIVATADIHLIADQGLGRIY